MSSVWKEAKAPDGRVYYYNTQTQATQWTKPDELAAPSNVSFQGHVCNDGSRLILSSLVNGKKQRLLTAALTGTIPSPIKQHGINLTP